MGDNTIATIIPGGFRDGPVGRGAGRQPDDLAAGPVWAIWRHSRLAAVAQPHLGDDWAAAHSVDQAQA